MIYTQPTFSVHYSNDEHDQLLAENLSLFEATCEYYEMIEDLEDDEWVTIYNEDHKIYKISDNV